MSLTGVIGVDIGGSTVKGCVVGGRGPVRTRRWPTRREHGPGSVVDVVLGAIDQLVTEAAAAGVRPDAVGLAVLGTVDEHAGVARASSTVRWEDVPIRRLVHERSGLPVAIGHDMRAAALAEARFGAARDHGHVLLLAIGAGLAVAQVIDGLAVTGASWRAGELGQLGVEKAPAGSSGASGATLEQVASGLGMARRLDRLLGRPDGTSTAVDVFAPGPDVADAAALVRDEAIDALADALALAVTMADPEVIVVGGGVAQAGEALLGPLRSRLETALGWREPPPLVSACFGADAAWIGAALLAWRRAGHADDRFPEAMGW
jgi:glucokinase